jgi:CheY-like chemotaxis protein
VIFITAYDEPESREQATRAGAAAFLIKPFAGHTLVQQVASAMGISPTQ